jgi:enoyl-[acyl-carrier protein] reductase I
MAQSEHGLMKGKRGIIMGIANDKSIAWGIAKTLSEHGAELAMSYYGESIKKRIFPLAESVGCSLIYECNASSDESMNNFFAELAEQWDSIDFVVHSVAFSDKNELTGQYVGTTRANFANTLDVSCYSFTALAQRAAKIMPNGGSMLTMSYLGAERVVPHYNVMGVAKAALEASVMYHKSKRNFRWAIKNSCCSWYR